MAMALVVVIAIALLAGLICVTWLLFQARAKLQRYRPISDLEHHRDALHKQAVSAQQQLSQLQESVGEEQAQLELLHTQVRAVEETVELQSFGFYRAHYGFESSEDYAARLQSVRDEQKALIKSDGAAHCPANWTVDGSATKGRKMVQEHTKLMLRAFNGECDAATAKVKYDNVQNLQLRIEKSFEALNKLGEAKQIQIDDRYLSLKLAELRLVHEHREKVQEEREEQRRIKGQMREEQKAEKELEKAKADAENEEARHQKALEKARQELAEATGQQHQKLEALVNKLESELAGAIDRKAKAIARAQLTKSGHVYVLSNVGSFGKNVYKIGMTRRFEPLERVNELGDASVPFKFDVHAMIYRENAPELEDALHQEFANRRVNKVNMRREYFRVTLEEIVLVQRELDI